MSYLDHAFSVILAGGGGTRLWPKSRNKTPKQFLKLTGRQTMMQYAASRATKLVDWNRVIVVTNEQYKDEVQAQLPKLPAENIIAEPAKKDTALAMLVGALAAQARDPDAVVFNLASDHIVVNETEYVRVMKAALSVASSENQLVTVGISPTFPSSGFGYIKIGQDLRKLGEGLSLFKVESFTEKPNTATARAFISTGRYFWNANMYVWSAKVLCQAFAAHQPEMYELTQSLITLKPREFQAALPAIYKEATAISIDYAISEKADNLVLIPGDFGWNDVGDWKVVYELGQKDASKNVIVNESDKGSTLVVDSHHNLIHANGKLIALCGIDNMVIVDTPEILMIVPKERSQDVKKLVEQLKENKTEEYL
ncbi:MAG: sugar phosphate nucleotidyltransferase [bacterium]|nr:sugar phosphate nucleotidyltransferase [bacterium]